MLFEKYIKKVKENKYGPKKIDARLLYYVTFAMLCFARFRVAKMTSLQIFLTSSLFH